MSALETRDQEVAREQAERDFEGERLKPVADMTLDEQIDELATYMPEQMPVLAVLLDETTLPKVLQSFRDREGGS
jgi:hypothetical protein